MEIWTWLLTVCSAIGVVGAAIVYIHKALEAIQEPQREIKKEFENIYALIQSNDDRIERTNRRVDKYEKTLEQIREATNLGMHNDLVILRHLATNNNTGEINETIQDVENWLINRKISGKIKTN